MNLAGALKAARDALTTHMPRMPHTYTRGSHILYLSLFLSRLLYTAQRCMCTNLLQARPPNRSLMGSAPAHVWRDRTNIAPQFVRHVRVNKSQQPRACHQRHTPRRWKLSAHPPAKTLVLRATAHSIYVIFKSNFAHAPKLPGVHAIVRECIFSDHREHIKCTEKPVYCWFSSV